MAIKDFASKINPFILVIFIAAIFFGVTDFEKRTIFGWDQARDAQAVFQIIKENKWTLIGPRAVGPDGFFLGPLWFYLLLPFYYLSNLDPIGASVFGILISIATTLSFYLVGKNLFGERIGLISAFIWLPSGQIIVWNPILIPFATLIFIFLLSKVISGEKKYIPLSFLWLGLSLQIHFQAFYFLVPLIFSLVFYFRKKRNLPLKDILIGVILLLLTFLPLIVFDLRHNFLELNSFLNFFFSDKGNEEQLISRLLFGLGKYLNGVSAISVLLLSVSGLVLSKINRNIKIILISFLLLPPLLFSFHQGNLSEYYFALTTVSLIFGIAIIFARISSLHYFGTIFLILLLGYISFNKVIAFKSSYSDTSLYNHKQAVGYLANQTVDEKYNVSYSVPPDGDTPFIYLFNLQKRKPDSSSSGHLWTIVMPADKEDIPPVVKFGDIGIIRR